MSEFLLLYLIICAFFILNSGRTLVTYFLYFCSVYSYISLVIFDFGYIVPFDLGVGLDKKLVIFPIFLIASCSVAFSLGQNLIFDKYNKNVKSNNVGTNSTFDSNKFKSNFFILVPIFTSLMVVSSVGIDNLLHRSSYVVSDANLDFRKYADITVWLAIVTTPFIKNRVLRLLCHIALLLSFVGLGSRSAMVVALSYPLFNYFINNLSKPKFLINIIIACITSIAVMSIRFKDYKGIIPVFEDIVNFNIDFEMSLYLINYLSSYSILLFSEYLYSHVLDYKYFLMSLSPLPGFMLDTDGIDQWARFRKSIPHSALSQLYGHAGLLVTLAFFLFHGALCGYLKSRILKTFGWQKIVFSLFLVVDLIFLIPVVRGMQYNLRGVSRLEYLVLAITLSLIVALYVARIVKRKNYI